MKLCNFRRFSGRIEWFRDSPNYVYGPIIKGKTINYKGIKRFSPRLSFCPNLAFENGYLIKTFKIIKEPLKKV